MFYKHGGFCSVLVLLSFITMLNGCASTYVEGEPMLNQAVQNEPIRFPPYNGSKLIVAVLPLGLSSRAAKRYPHLLSKDVGLGIHNRVVDALFDSGRFRLTEEKHNVIKEIMDRQWMSSAGMVDESTAVSLGRILGAKKVIYGEVYDYAEGGEKVVGLSAYSKYKIKIAVQVRLVDVETLEYVPASGEGYGVDVGMASEKAIRKAVYTLIKRLDGAVKSR